MAYYSMDDKALECPESRWPVLSPSKGMSEPLQSSTSLSVMPGLIGHPVSLLGSGGASHWIPVPALGPELVEGNE